MRTREEESEIKLVHEERTLSHQTEFKTDCQENCRKIGTGPEMNEGVQSRETERCEDKRGRKRKKKDSRAPSQQEWACLVLLVLFVESHLPLLCSKHHPYLMRPLQSPGKKRCWELFCNPPHPSPLSPSLKFSPYTTFLFHNSLSFLLSIPVLSLSLSFHHPLVIFKRLIVSSRSSPKPPNSSQSETLYPISWACGLRAELNFSLVRFKRGDSSIFFLSFF